MPKDHEPVSQTSSTPAARTAPDSTALAWELASAVRPHISSADVHHIAITIGTGETFDAIDMLITTLAREHIAITEALAATVKTWLHCYTGQPAIPRLHELLAEVKTLQHHQTSPTTTKSGDGGGPGPVTGDR